MVRGLDVIRFRGRKNVGQAHSVAAQSRPSCNQACVSSTRGPSAVPSGTMIPLAAAGRGTPPGTRRQEAVRAAADDVLRQPG
jgi:hypothetical protein